MSLSRKQTEARLAEMAGVSEDAVSKVLKELEKLVYRQARMGFVIPGFGMLKAVCGPERKGRNPTTGEVIRLPGNVHVQFELDSTMEERIIAEARESLNVLDRE